MHLAAGKRGTGNNPLFARLQVVFQQVGHRRTTQCTHDTWFLDAGAGNCNQALVIKNTATEEFANRQQVLHIEMPCDLVRTNRVDKVNMGTYQSGRMYAAKAVDFQTVQIMGRYESFLAAA